MLAAHAAGAQFGDSPVNIATVPQPRLPAGALVGSYRIDRLMGTGGMGEVDRARDTKLGRDVALKVLPAAFTSDADLAKAFAGESTDLSQAPTISVDGTQPGVIAGKPAYMSPEQTRGHTIDERTNIWAFGCVLYEMLTAQPAFRLHGTPGHGGTEVTRKKTHSSVSRHLGGTLK